MIEKGTERRLRGEAQVRQGKQVHQLQWLTSNSIAYLEREGVALPIHLYGQPIERQCSATGRKDQARGFLQACCLRRTDDNKAVRARQIDQRRTDDNFLIVSAIVLSIELFSKMTRARNRLRLVVPKVTAAYHQSGTCRKRAVATRA